MFDAELFQFDVGKIVQKPDVVLEIHGACVRQNAEDLQCRQCLAQFSCGSAENLGAAVLLVVRICDIIPIRAQDSVGKATFQITCGHGECCGRFVQCGQLLIDQAGVPFGHILA